MKQLVLPREDFEKWYKVALLFLGPVAVIYCIYVKGQIEVDGFQWTDFIPNEFVWGSIFSYLLNEALAYFKRIADAK